MRTDTAACPNCGSENDRKANYCQVCCYRLTPEEEAPDTKAAVAVQESPALSKMNVTLLVVLTTITGGIYGAVWFLTRRRELNSLQAESKLGLAAPIAAIVLFVAAGFGTLGLQVGNDIMAIAGAFLLVQFVTLLAWVILLFQCYGVLHILEAHFNSRRHLNVHLSRPLTLFLAMFYLQHKINELAGMQ